MAPVVVGMLRGLIYFRGAHKRAAKLAAGEGVILDREPTNDADCNAIRVLNANSRELGYIDRVAAAILSSHIDSGTIYTANIITPPVVWYKQTSKGRVVGIRMDSCTIRCVPLPPLKQQRFRYAPLVENELEFLTPIDWTPK